MTPEPKRRGLGLGRRLGGAVAVVGRGPAAVGRGLRAGGRRTVSLPPSQPVLLLIVVVILGASALMTFRKYFLKHVPSGHMLVKVSKFGNPLAEGQILAGPGQKGVREHVLGEGWHP